MLIAADANDGTNGIDSLKKYNFEIIDNDKNKGKAAGIIFLADGNKILLIKRSPDSDDYPSTWAFPAGKIETLEKPIYAAMRECEEEIGFSMDAYDSIPELMKITDKGFYCYLYKEHGTFTPTLNDENTAYGWFYISDLPNPMHPDALGLIRYLKKSSI